MKCFIGVPSDSKPKEYTVAVVVPGYDFDDRKTSFTLLLNEFPVRNEFTSNMILLESAKNGSWREISRCGNTERVFRVEIDSRKISRHRKYKILYTEDEKGYLFTFSGKELV